MHPKRCRNQFPFGALLMAGAILQGSASSAEAQVLRIQQPVFGVNSVGTTVVVPDRGSIHLGGVRRAGMAAQSRGPFRRGSIVSSFQEQSGITAHVVIHDLAEMDRMILEQAERFPRQPGMFSVSEPGEIDSSRAGPAFHQLQGSGTARSPKIGASARIAEHATASDRTPELSVTTQPEKAQRAFRLGQQAEQRGADGVAKLHYQLAAKYGSSAAAERLHDLETP